jgi:hypothetical protein
MCSLVEGILMSRSIMCVNTLTSLSSSPSEGALDGKSTLSSKDFRVFSRTTLFEHLPRTNWSWCLENRRKIGLMKVCPHLFWQPLIAQLLWIVSRPITALISTAGVSATCSKSSPRYPSTTDAHSCNSSLGHPNYLLVVCPVCALEI